MNYRIIGDIHGRKNWKDLICSSEDVTHIFLGDYFSPYDTTSYEDCMANLLEIMAIPNKILLLGNHDLEGFLKEKYSRHDYKHENEIYNFFKDNMSSFTIAHAISRDTICTHAGVSNNWASYRLDKWTDAYDLGEKINTKFTKNPSLFNFENNCGPSDNYGQSTTHSPIWIRPQSLISSQIMLDIDGASTPLTNIVGHTKVRKIFATDKLVCCDCLEYTTQCLSVSDGDFKIITI